LKKAKNILVCPLDWGLGHATRIVPIVDMLISKGAKVIIAADNSPMDFLKQRFANCEFVKLPGFEPKYPKGNQMALKMALQYPAMIKSATKAKKVLNSIVENRSVDIIISDNRYENFHPKTYSIIISHQINIRTNGIQNIFNPFINRKIKNYLRKFDELWIPDIEGSGNLSGKLSHGTRIPNRNYYYIGPLSRFAKYADDKIPIKNDLMVILSGPEPQRSIFERKVESQILKTGLKTIILSAKPASSKIEENNNILKLPHLPDKEFAKTILESEIIISRPGYSTLMDLANFGKKAIFIPTPGQTEQEYIAERLGKNKNYPWQKQAVLDLSKAIKEISKYKAIKLKNDFNLLENRIDFLIK
jgi:uncharacterized protein (TIGR00661 family)